MRGNCHIRYESPSLFARIIMSKKGLRRGREREINLRRYIGREAPYILDSMQICLFQEWFTTISGQLCTLTRAYRLRQERERERESIKSNVILSTWKIKNEKRRLTDFIGVNRAITTLYTINEFFQISHLFSRVDTIIYQRWKCNFDMFWQSA